MPAQILKSNISNTSHHLGAGAKHVGRKPKWMQKLKKNKEKGKNKPSQDFCELGYPEKKKKSRSSVFLFSL